MWRLQKTVIPKILTHWHEVACNSLHYDSSTVEEIDKNCADDPKMCCYKLFKDWLDTENGVKPKTWETLLTQLKEVAELTDKVEEIMKEL